MSALGLVLGAVAVSREGTAVDIVIDAAGHGVAVGSTASPDPVHGGTLRASVVLLRIAPDGTY